MYITRAWICKMIPIFTVWNMSTRYRFIDIMYTKDMHRLTSFILVLLWYPPNFPGTLIILVLCYIYCNFFPLSCNSIHHIILKLIRRSNFWVKFQSYNVKFSGKLFCGSRSVVWHSIFYSVIPLQLKNKNLSFNCWSQEKTAPLRVVICYYFPHQIPFHYDSRLRDDDDCGCLN